MKKITVLGAGSWGTTLAVVAARRGHRVVLCTRDQQLAAEMTSTRRNMRSLPDTLLPEDLQISVDSKSAITGSFAVLLALPAQQVRKSLISHRHYFSKDTLLVCASKGIEADTGLRMSEVTDEVFAGHPAPTHVCLSGPSFAREVAEGTPTAVVCSSREIEYARLVQSALSTARLRIYANDDLAGTEICGSVKNVMALAAGMIAGLGLGANTLAALITRGLAEIMRLAVAFGGRTETMLGLAGVGDLVLTCTGEMSRNRYVGEQMGRGRSLAAVLKEMTEVAEGVETTRAVMRISEATGIEMPITAAVSSVLNGRITPAQAIESLLTRPLKDEFVPPESVV